jgi:hypothetical protein
MSGAAGTGDHDFEAACLGLASITKQSIRCSMRGDHLGLVRDSELG